MAAAVTTPDVAEEEAVLLAEADKPQVMSGKMQRFTPLAVVSTLAAMAALVTLLGARSTAVAASSIDSHVLKAYAASMTCYSYTGVTCSMLDCDAGLHATCQDRKCVCEAGCSGPDGKCYNGETNQLISTGFALKNLKWPNYAMYFQGTSVFGQMKTTNAWSFLNLGKDKFQLYRLPGPANATRFVLGSVAYPGHIARIGMTTGTSAFSSHALYATGLDDGKGMDTLSVSVCYHSGKRALMIGSKAGDYWAYIHRGSWLVYASDMGHCSVGDGGLWVPEPALSAEEAALLPSCAC